MSIKPTWRERLSYAFDRTLSRGPSALIGWLALGTALLIGLGTLAVLLLHGIPDQSNMFDVFWNIMSQALTPNPVDSGNPFSYLAVMFVVTVGSLFMVSILIGILSNEIEARVDALRRGRSKVLENEHTVILGWSNQVFTIISELVIANENRKSGAVVVVLADKDKVEMEDEIRARIPRTKNTRIICRNGDPIELSDLEIVSLHSARSVIILPPDEDDPDIFVIKTILAITNDPKRRAEKYHVVTQVHDAKNMDVVRMIGKNDDVQAVLVGDLIARVVAQTSRQSGLSVVYTELMNFEGDEIYFQEEPTLVGKTYRDALLAYETSSVMGLRLTNGKILLNPPPETMISSGDKVFAVSEDDDMVIVSGLANIPMDESAIQKSRKNGKASPEKALIMGWNRWGTVIVRELDSYVPKGSQIAIVSEANAAQEIKDAGVHLTNQKLVIRNGDTTDRALLHNLKVDQYDHIIVLADSDLAVQEADARTLVTLLHLRDIAEKNKKHFSVVSEMRDLRNRELAEAARVDDFIVSEHLVSLMMSQLAENSELYDVFTDIFDPEGSEIYLKPIADYVETGKPINFYTVVESASRRAQTAIGYRIVAEMGDASKSYGVHTNPKKSELVAFAPEDKIIVVSEN
jgi:ion channel POLLUX/CASTOR